MNKLVAFCISAAVSLAALSSLAPLATSSRLAHAAEPGDISIAELKAAMAAKKVAIVDVNGDDSYADGHIPGAIVFEGKDKLAKALPADKSTLVVAYCGGAACNTYRAATKAAESFGYTNVKHLSVGIRGWKAAGEKLEAKK